MTKRFGQLLKKAAGMAFLFCIACTAAPLRTEAETLVEVRSVDEIRMAIENATEDIEIKLMENVKDDEDLGVHIKMEMAYNVTIDLNGKTWTKEDGILIYSMSQKTLTVTDSGTGGIMINENGRIVIQCRESTLRILGGIFEGREGGNYEKYSGNAVIDCIGGAKAVLEVKGGIIRGRIGINNFPRTTFDMSGGLIEAEYKGIVNWENSVFNMTGGTVISKDRGIELISESVSHIGGTAHIVANSIPIEIYRANPLLKDSGSLNVTGGIIESKMQKPYVTIRNCNYERSFTVKIAKEAVMIPEGRMYPGHPSISPKPSVSESTAQLSAGTAVYNLTSNDPSLNDWLVYNNLGDFVPSLDVTAVSSGGKLILSGKGLTPGKTYYTFGYDRANGYGPRMYLELEVTEPQVLAQVLKAPTGVAWDPGTIGMARWDAVDGVVGYLVQLYREGVAVGGVQSVAQGVSHNFAPAMVEPGMYTFTVQAVGDGNIFLSSVASVQSNGHVQRGNLPVPTGVVWDQGAKGMAKWDAVSNATAYLVQLYKDGIAVGGVQTVTGIAFDFSQALTVSGQYTFTVQAVGGGMYYMDSDISAPSSVYLYQVPEVGHTVKKGTKFNSGIYQYQVTDNRTGGKGTVQLIGFKKGKSASEVKVKGSVKYKDISYKVTVIGSKAFYKNGKVKKVDIGGDVTDIGSKAFYGCGKLSKVTIGDKVTVIGDQAFKKCGTLSSVGIGKGLKKIGSYVFSNDKKLRTLSIKSTKLAKIGKKNLEGCEKLKVKVPSSKVKAYTKLFKNQGQKKNVKVTK